MEPTRRPPPIEEKAPSLFGYIRGGLKRTEDDTGANTRIGSASPNTGQVNVGVSSSGRSGFRLPRGLVIWAIVLVVIGLLGAAIYPMASQVATEFSQSFDEAFQDSTPKDKEPKRQHADDAPGTVTIGKDANEQLNGAFAVLDCVRDAGSDTAKIAKCNSDGPVADPSTPSPSTSLSDLTRMSDCVASAAGDTDRILDCIRR